MRLSSLSSKDLTARIKAKALAVGFHQVGIARVTDGDFELAAQRLASWLALGYNADMAWMDSPKRRNIKELLPEAQSVIALALNYYTPHQRSGDRRHGKISRYGWGRDYHRVLTKKLKALNLWLAEQVPDLISRYYVDTGPIQDKAWAERAGIGWVGKNGNVINRNYGSWIFLGEIVTNIPLNGDRPHSQHCGTCNRCLEACPTQAIVEPFVIDSNKCIAYHTIENRDKTLPPAIAKNLQGWVAGCDICQDVCPWNQRFAQATDVAEFNPYTENLNPNLEELAEISQETWEKQFTASALRRIKPAMLQRNARANLQ